LVIDREVVKARVAMTQARQSQQSGIAVCVQVKDAGRPAAPIIGCVVRRMSPDLLSSKSTWGMEPMGDP
jgi:hypothetical protein